jgi:predicted DNA-binding transcriptional regulator AlpA
MRTPVALSDRTWLTIPQVQRLMGKGRQWVESRIAANDFDSVRDGQRVKVVTASIKAWVDHQTTAQRTTVGLPVVALMEAK